jgi:hypothetical protein
MMRTVRCGQLAVAAQQMGREKKGANARDAISRLRFIGMLLALAPAGHFRPMRRHDYSE